MMNSRNPVLGLLSLALCAALPAFADHSHGQDETQTVTTAPNAIPPVRHATDAPLREGMSRIHAALDELTHYDKGHMPQAMAVERVDTIKAATDYIFAHCKLAPTADAALHGMLVPLLNGVRAFQKDPADTSSISAMRNAVADYPRVFDDPNWPIESADDSDYIH